MFSAAKRAKVDLAFLGEHMRTRRDEFAEETEKARLIGKSSPRASPGQSLPPPLPRSRARRRTADAARPMNAIVHIVTAASADHDGEGGRNTLLGLGIHTAASVWWRHSSKRRSPRTRPRRPATASVLSAIAYVVDYYVVSKRFGPGFETCLSPRAMFAVYAALAAGFAFSGSKRRALIRKRQNQRKGAALAGHARQPELAAEQPRQLAADR